MAIRYTIISVCLPDYNNHLNWKSELSEKVNKLIDINFIPLGNPFVSDNFFNQVMWKPKEETKRKKQTAKREN